MSAALRVAVVGAGVFGLAAALELAARGHRVAVWEQGPIPNPRASSTDVSKAIRRTWYAGDNDTYVELVERAALGWRRWEQQLGVTLLHRAGILSIVDRFEPGAPLYESWRYLQTRGASEVELLDTVQLRRRFPMFDVAGGEVGLYDGWAGYLESGVAVAGMARLAQTAGVELHQRATVSALEETGDGAQLRVGAGWQRADAVVCAAGAWAGRLLPVVGAALHVTRQQMVLLRLDATDQPRFSYPGFPVWSVDPDGAGWYGFPLLREGVVKVAQDPPGPEVDADHDRAGTPAFAAQAMQFLRRRIPGLAGASIVEGRSCLYAITPDDHFFIDRVPDMQRVIVAGGGSGHGFKFGGAIGPLIADRVEGVDNALGARFRIGTRLATARAGAAGRRGYAAPRESQH